jgi:hypothetical protein
MRVDINDHHGGVSHVAANPRKPNRTCRLVTADRWAGFSTGHGEDHTADGASLRR